MQNERHVRYTFNVLEFVYKLIRPAGIANRESIRQFAPATFLEPLGHQMGRAAVLVQDRLEQGPADFADLYLEPYEPVARVPAAER